MVLNSSHPQRARDPNRAPPPLPRPSPPFLPSPARNPTPRARARVRPCRRDAPLAGRGEDEFELCKGRLLVHSANWVGGREIRYTQTYERRA